MSPNLFGQGKLPLQQGNLTLTIVICLMCYDTTTVLDYWHIPLNHGFKANFLTFQMLVLIGADSSIISNCKFVWKSWGIYSLWKVATLCFE
jgi:hypothetical protein